MLTKRGYYEEDEIYLSSEGEDAGNINTGFLYPSGADLYQQQEI
jgi:hypothetical protein